MFPAYVGMNRVKGRLNYLDDHVPRIRGDEPPKANTVLT